MRVLHIGNEMSWRGGENQIRLLVEGLRAHGVESTIAFPKKSRAFEKFKSIAVTVPLASKSAYDPRSVLRLVKYCRENKVDIIDAHSSGGMSLALAVKKRLPHIKLVVHRRVAIPIKNNWFTKRKYLNIHVDRFVCISNAIADVLANYGVPNRKIVTVRSAVDAPAQEVIIPLKSEWRQLLPVKKAMRF
jgi:L-malate glycosyltransferase